MPLDKAIYSRLFPFAPGAEQVYRLPVAAPQQWQDPEATKWADESSSGTPPAKEVARPLAPVPPAPRSAQVSGNGDELDNNIEDLTQIGKAASQGVRYGADNNVDQLRQIGIAGRQNERYTGNPGDTSQIYTAQSSPLVNPTLLSKPDFLEQQAKQAIGSLGSPRLDAPADNSPAAMKEAAKPHFTPDPSKTDAENELARNQFIAQNPTNQDHGVKGFLKELAQNFFFGLSHAQPGMNVGQSLLLGGVGAGAGVANRSWNERRAAEGAIPQLQQQVDFDTQQAARKAQTANVAAQPADRDAERQRKAEKDSADNDYKQARLGWDREKQGQLSDLIAKRNAATSEYQKGMLQARIDSLAETATHNRATETQAKDNAAEKAAENVRRDTRITQKGSGGTIHSPKIQADVLEKISQGGALKGWTADMIKDAQQAYKDTQTAKPSSRKEFWGQTRKQ